MGLFVIKLYICKNFIEEVLLLSGICSNLYKARG